MLFELSQQLMLAPNRQVNSVMLIRINITYQTINHKCKAGINAV